MKERSVAPPNPETENIQRVKLGILGTDSAYLYLGDLDRTSMMEASEHKGPFDESVIHNMFYELLLRNGSKNVTFLPLLSAGKKSKNVNGVKLDVGADGDYEPILELGTDRKQIAIRSGLDVDHITKAVQNRVYYGQFSVPSGVLLLTANSLDSLEAKMDRPSNNDFTRANMLRVLANARHAQLPRFPDELFENDNLDSGFLSRESHGIVVRVNSRKYLQVFSEVRYEPEKNQIPHDFESIELHPNHYDFKHYFIIDLG